MKGSKFPIRALVSITRSTGIAIIVCLLGHTVVAQSRSIVWPKEPGRRIRPAGVPGGQANAVAQFDTLEIEEILVEGKPIIIGQPFDASDDWLKHITIRVKNISEQRFSFIQVDLIFPQTIRPPIEYADGKKYEEYWIPLAYPFTADQRAKGFGPGEVVELTTWKDETIFNRWTAKLAELAPLSTITIAQIRTVLVILPDGSSLLSECIRTANPQNACPHSGAP
jgi:hypothetical protein